MNYREKFLARCVKLYMNQGEHKLLTINEPKIQQVAAEISVTPEEASWDFYLPKNLQVQAGASPEVVQEVCYYFFVMFALQFCFWEMDDADNLQHWLYQGNPKLKGSAGLAQLMIDCYEQSQYPGVHLNEDDTYTHYLKLFDDVGIPHAEKRAVILKSLADYDDFTSDIYPRFFANFDWNLNTAMVVSNVYETAYLDPFFKKIQLCLGVVASNLRARGLDVQSDFTAYSDYRLPQILRQLGVLEYTPVLAGLVDSQVLLNDVADVEDTIRAATVLACEKLALTAGVRATDVDCYLFLKSRDADFMDGIRPFHLVETTHY